MNRSSCLTLRGAGRSKTEGLAVSEGFLAVSSQGGKAEQRQEEQSGQT